MRTRTNRLDDNLDDRFDDHFGDGPDRRLGDPFNDARECSPSSPVGRPFPSVGGTALSGENVHFPEDVAGAPAVLLVAYQRMAHADVASWLEFLASRKPDLAVYELPTIPAVAFRSWASWIDNNMRNGIPQALWPRVVTLYSDGEPVREFLGNSDFVGASVVLLDAAGVVRWFSIGGFRPDRGGGLLDELHRLGDQPPD